MRTARICAQPQPSLALTDETGSLVSTAGLCWSSPGWLCAPLHSFQTAPDSTLGTVGCVYPHHASLSSLVAPGLGIGCEHVHSDSLTGCLGHLVLAGSQRFCSFQHTSSSKAGEHSAPVLMEATAAQVHTMSVCPSLRPTVCSTKPREDSTRLPARPRGAARTVVLLAATKPTRQLVPDSPKHMPACAQAAQVRAL